MNGIVVGVDGSKQSLRAVDWAADEAVRRNAPLRILYVVTPWLFDVPVDPRAGAMRAWLLYGGEDIVGYAVDRAGERAPGLDVTGEQIGGQAAELLVDRAQDALMLVVGSRGRGGVGGLVLGSVAFQVASHARCPAVVVRDAPSEEYGEVALGVDGSPASTEAVGFAFGEASVRRARLHAVLAWPHPISTGPGDMQPLVYDPEVVTKGEERVLSECLSGWRAKFPDVEVVPEVVHGRAAPALVRASEQADLLVVGSRGRGGFTGLLLGSVGHAMLHRSRCPVAVVAPA
ncbi:universal stress protein [Actinomadura nitritigenes]|uniref:Universal stress protein n=1 Tax=Actinomadura nitritigenes TaxID=134602 RepID=A0ABS3R5E6_9ACTN|nr:universal stress protein [Actinomadura nitritigenes]MBO2441351.1 universal stress protein [Actinomadura nitritigenes]